MRSPVRFLKTTSSDHFPAPAPGPPSAAPEPPSVGSDVVVLLAALLFAFICGLGLALVARCTWLRRQDGGASNKGLKKKVISSLPKQSYSGGGVVLADCPICLAEFAQGDEIRILPQCGHGFHVGCIDTWFVSHSSCPFCRRVLDTAAERPPSNCQRCGTSSNYAAVFTSTM